MARLKNFDRLRPESFRIAHATVEDSAERLKSGVWTNVASSVRIRSSAQNV